LTRRCGDGTIGNTMVTNSEPKDVVFRALADPVRREILQSLSAGSQPVNRLAGRFTISRPAISRHLKLLKQANLIGLSEVGRENLYYLKDDALRQLAAWLETFWNKKLSALKALAEKDSK